MSSSQYSAERVEEVISPFTVHTNEQDLYRLACTFCEQYRTLAATSEEHFLPTPVTAFPTGTEKGNFLAIDIGGTNLRVRFVDLLGKDGSRPEKSSLPEPSGEQGLSMIRLSKAWAWPIGDHLKMDKADDLFKWIGDCIAEALAGYISEESGELAGDVVPLGITFSFPMR